MIYTLEEKNERLKFLIFDNHGIPNKQQIKAIVPVCVSVWVHVCTCACTCVCEVFPSNKILTLFQTFFFSSPSSLPIKLQLFFPFGMMQCAVKIY